MENRSFEEDSGKKNPPEDPNEDLSGLTKAEPQAGPSGISKDQSKEAEPKLEDDEENESPPAYVQRYMREAKPQRAWIKRIEELDDDPYVQPIEENPEVRFNPEFQQQARNRRERRARQNLVDGPCALRPDIPNLAPLAEPEPYLDPTQEAPPVSAEPPAAPTLRERFQTISARIYSFSFQFPFHTLLLTWPLATAVMGVLNLSVCRMNDFLPFVMLAVGLLGTTSVIFRLYTLLFQKRVTNQDLSNYWLAVQFLELVVWDLFVAQLVYFFKQPPSFNPGDEHFCKSRFYKINCGVMGLSSITMLGWVIVHVPKFICCVWRTLRKCRRT